MAITAAISTNLVPNAIDLTQQQVLVDGTLTLSGTYPTNGDTLSFAGLGIPSNSLPTKVEIWEATPAPGPATGYAFIFVPGTTQYNGLMEIFNGTTQVTTQAYSSFITVTGFTLRFRAYFPNFV